MTEPLPAEMIWCVVRVDVTRGTPINATRYSHADAARDAARRLQRQNPQSRFGVMQLIETTRPGDDCRQSSMF